MLACVHFVVETSFTLTAPLGFATILPLIISSKQTVSPVQHLTFIYHNNYLLCILCMYIYINNNCRREYPVDADVLVLRWSGA